MKNRIRSKDLTSAPPLIKFLDFLGNNVPVPLRFSTPLPFSDEDKTSLPWLRNETRIYEIEREIGKGGRATAYYGSVIDEAGRPWKKAPTIVIKVPNIDPSAFTSRDIKEYLERQVQEGSREWQLTRERLRGCRYANPICDFDVRQVLYLNELMPMPLTAQLFLEEAEPLDSYLLRIKQRSEPYRSVQGKPVDNWNGMNSAVEWIKLARTIAIGLADIHQRRVVHGDIWPPNIFIREESPGNAYPVFIDFGEAFPLEPKGDPRHQRDHAYRAPERKNSESIVTQQVDVYSFGKLLLHLATGEEPTLKASVRGHERREGVRQRLKQRNQAIVNDNPFIMDIICNCIIVDPVDRPSMDEVVRAFDSYVDFQREPVSLNVGVIAQTNRIQKAWREVKEAAETSGGGIGPLLEGLISQKLSEIEPMIQNLGKDVVILRETRERLIVALVSLFQKLGDKDRFLSLTSPRLWQGSALGLDGRYFTATRLAASRGALIQRSFVVSVQELGSKWVEEWIRNLKENGAPRAAKLALLLDEYLSSFRAACHQGKAQELSGTVLASAQLRLRLVLKSYSDASKDFAKSGIQQADFQDSAGGSGLYVGLLVQGTMNDVRVLKAAYPVSVFYFSREPIGDRYLLLMTDCHGRNSIGTVGFEELSQSEPIPELRGITVFKSVMGVPEDRIKTLEGVFRESVNIGCWIDDVLASLPELRAAGFPPQQ